jgi:hypothetical protein
MEDRRIFLDKVITVCWFVMDLSWMSQCGWLSTTFMFFALVAILWDVWLDKFSLTSLATLFWLSANSMWMIHDLFAINLLLYAKVSACLGLLMVLYLIATDKKFKLRFRRWS